MRIALGPNMTTDEFPLPWTRDVKISIFEDKINGWMLNIAEELDAKIPHSGYAILSIVLSYFEMIVHYRDGKTEDLDELEKGGRPALPSAELFKEGVLWVVNDMGWPQKNQDEIERFQHMLYDFMRCGLFHSGIAYHKVWVSGHFGQVYVFRGDDLIIDPKLLTKELKDHFDNYIGELRKGTNPSLVKNFEKRFDVAVTKKVKKGLSA
ncbi:MAG: hypothetical protein V1792_06000 [Pseudomonadota bacterium]